MRPDQITDYLGLAGDAVDNIPGVKGIGGKIGGRAPRPLRRTWKISTSGSTSSPGSTALRGARSLHAKLAANREIAFLSKQLATVPREVPGVKADLKSLEYQGADPAKVEALFGRLGFNKIRERVPVYRLNPCSKSSASGSSKPGSSGVARTPPAAAERNGFGRRPSSVRSQGWTPRREGSNIQYSRTPERS